MPQAKNRQFLDFEKPIKELFDEIEKLKQTGREVTKGRSEWIPFASWRIRCWRSVPGNHPEFIPVAEGAAEPRHPDRPYTLKYIEKMCTNFVELFGDPECQG